MEVQRGDRSLLGALLMMLFLQPHDIIEALGFSTAYATPLVHTWNVVLILIELMVISTFLDDYGFFGYWCGKSNAHGRRRYEKAVHLVTGSPA